MTVLKTLLMSYLISVAYGGHLQVGERKNVKNNCSRKECSANELCITYTFISLDCLQMQIIYTYIYKVL